VPNEQCENLVRIYEGAIAINCADPVAIAVGAERSVVFSGAHRHARGFDVGFDRLGVNARKAGIAGAANFVATDPVAREQLAEQACGRAVHGIAYEAKLCFAQALPIDQFFNCIEIGRTRLEGLN
jgi:hypothetical protein